MDSQVVYRHTPEMGEISGFGGGYETICQDMLEAGVKWIMERRPDDLQGGGLALKHEMGTVIEFYGLFEENSEQAKELGRVVVNASEERWGKEYVCTGAMHHAVMARLFKIAEHGWGWYVDEVTKHHAERTK